MKGFIFGIVAAVAAGLPVVIPSAAFADMSVLSSAFLPTAGDVDYGPENLTDRGARTAWCVSGKAGGPAWIALTFDKPTPLPVLGWLNGYHKSSGTYRANARVRTVAAYADGQLLGRFGLEDRMSPQRLNLPTVLAREYRFAVEAVYPGAKYDDLCVTEILADQRTLEGYRLIDSLAKKTENRPAGRTEIAEYAAIYDFWRNFFNERWNPVNPNDGDGPFWDALALKASARDEAGLRAILNLDHYTAGLKIVHSELLEGLRDTVIGYIADDAAMVADIWEDKEQAGRNTLESAFYMFIDPWGPGGVLKRRANDPGFNRLVLLVCGRQTEKAHYCGAS